MLTDVYDMETCGIYASYSLEPKQAIIAAWEQYHKNFNTWEYAKKLEQEFYHLNKTKHGYTLGKFWVKR